MPGSNGHPTSLDRDDIDALKAAIDLPAFFEEHGVALQKTGQNWKGRCPFHEDDTPSLSINPREQLWRCFGCGQGGDVFSFLKLKEDMGFPEAVAYLRERYGLAPLPPQPTTTERPGTIDGIETLAGGFTRPQLLGRVADFYRQRLAESKAARAYLRQRSLDAPELIEAFRLGFSDGEALLKTLPAEGELRQAMTTLGVITAKGRELFAGCIVIPLEHPELGVVGLYGRKISDRAQVPHLYLPGPQRGVLNWQALNASSTVYVAESVFDALSLWVAGQKDVTCTFGVKGIHKDLDELIGRYAVHEIRLCMDADAAGREATVRMATTLARRGVRCVQVELPDGHDPNRVLTERGATTLLAATEQCLAIELQDAPARQTAAYEETADGFVVTFTDVSYRVTPRPPFKGKLCAHVRPTKDGRTVVDTIDLFMHRARMTLASQVSRHFKLSKDEAEQHLLAVLEHAERWVADRMQAEGDPDAVKAPPPMNAAEREEALAFLRRPDLKEAILEDMAAVGYTGEENGKLLSYLIGISRRLERPLSGIVRSQSGAGKSAMTELVETLTPPEEVILYSRISAQALCYLPKDYLKRKLLILEERVGAEQADYSIRVLQSKSRLSQATVVKDPATGRMTTRHYEVEGPIAYLETTTSSRINHENATRCFEIHLDESEAQTQRIQVQQREARIPGGGRKRSLEALCRRHHNAQRLLDPVTVYMPFAPLMTFPTRWLRTRRDHQRFLCLIEAAAFLHQHQRESGVEAVEGKSQKFIQATIADYRLAYDLAREVLRVTLHELSRDAGELWEAAKSMAGTRETKGAPTPFTRRDLRQFTDWHDHRVRDALAELVEMEYLAVVGGSQGRTFQYRLIDVSSGQPLSLRELMTPEQLESKMREAGLLP